MDKKYLIYVASTLEDLKNERKEIPHIIMELGHIPVLPEFTDAENGGGKLLAQKNQEACDYCVFLQAHRYNPAAAEEHVLAIQKGIPVIALVLDGKARWKASKRETDAGALKKLEAFRAKLLSGVCAEWGSAADLRQKAQSLLIREINLRPRPGWIPANLGVDPAVANELSRLSGENEELRRRIKMENSDVVTKIRDQMRHALRVLALNKVTMSFYYDPGENWENPRKFRYLRIWKLLVPELSLGKTTAGISRFLGRVLNPDLEKTVRKDYPIPSNTIRKIMADFALLKLAKCSGQGDEEVWEITGYGKELYSVYRIRQLERSFKKP
jgi:hypothetical protein